MEAQWHDPHVEFLRKLAFQRAKRAGNNLVFLRSLRHRWDIVTEMHRFQKDAFQEIFGQSIFDLVIQASDRPLTASTIAQTKPGRVRNIVPVVCLPDFFVASFPSDIIGLLKQFIGPPPLTQSEPKLEECADLPDNGSYPMVPTVLPMIKVI